MIAHRSRLAATALVAAAAFAVVAASPTPAQAQFGGLLKKAKEKAAEKVAEKAVDKAAEKAGAGDSTKAAAAAAAAGAPSGGGGRATRSRGGRVNGAATYAATGPAPTYTANLLEITNERIDQLMKGLDAERAYAAQRAKGDDAAQKRHEADMQAYEAKKIAYDKKMADINARMAAFQDCAMSNAGAAGPNAMPSMAKMQQKLAGMSEAERQAFMNRMEDLGKRGDAAKKRGDNRTMMAIADTVNTLMGITEEDRRAAAAAMKNHKDCGTPPAEMTNPSLLPKEPQPPHESSASEQSQKYVDQTGAKAAGLTVEQYGVLRERIAALVLYNGRPGTAWGFSEAERNAVATRRNEFNKYEDLLGGGAISWRFSGSSD